MKKFFSDWNNFIFISCSGGDDSTVDEIIPQNTLNNELIKHL